MTEPNDPLDNPLEFELPMNAIWQALLNHDPGPAVAFFDLLVNSDFSFAADGFLRDLAERMLDADDHVDSEEQRAQFCDAVRQTISHCLQHDVEAVEQLLQEAAEDG